MQCPSRGCLAPQCSGSNVLGSRAANTSYNLVESCHDVLLLFDSFLALGLGHLQLLFQLFNVAFLVMLAVF